MPQIKPQACIKALQKAGFEIKRQTGSHVILRRDFPVPARTVPVPTGKKSIPQGTLSAIWRQAGLSRAEFFALLED